MRERANGPGYLESASERHELDTAGEGRGNHRRIVVLHGREMRRACEQEHDDETETRRLWPRSEPMYPDDSRCAQQRRRSDKD